MGKLTTFFELINAQFTYGGQKYAHNDKKESTDCLFDDFGKGWLYGTMGKYTKRIKNLKRERDILKISTYLFILWLKRGFHLSPNGQEEPINTTVETKSTYFAFFEEITVSYIGNTLMPLDVDMDNLYNIFGDWAKKDWEELTEEDLLEAFNMCFAYWLENFSETAGSDQDCWNENKGDKNEKKN